MFIICYDDVTVYPVCDIIVGIPEVTVGGFSRQCRICDRELLVRTDFVVLFCCLQGNLRIVVV